MAEQSWFNAEPVGGESSSFFANDPAAPPPMPRRSSAYELRPLTTGEVLDRTFFLYRNNFWLFAGLSSIAAAVSTVTSIAQQVYFHFSKTGPDLTQATPALAAGRIGSTIAMGLVAAALYLVVYSVTQAATVSAVSAIYLGDPTSMRQALNAVTGRWYRYVAIALWQFWSGIWLYAVLLGPGLVGIVLVGKRGKDAVGVGPIVVLTVLILTGALAGPIYGLIAYIRNSLAVAAEVMEGLTIRAAMKRSKGLAAGTKGRIFLLFLFLAALYVVAIAVESPLTFLILKHKGLGVGLYQAMLIFVNFIVSSVIAPVGAIGLCLFYIDQRVRKEGFDIDFLIERSGPAPVVMAEDAVGLP